MLEIRSVNWGGSAASGAMSSMAIHATQSKLIDNSAPKPVARFQLKLEHDGYQR